MRENRLPVMWRSDRVPRGVPETRFVNDANSNLTYHASGWMHDRRSAGPRGSQWSRLV